MCAVCLNLMCGEADWRKWFCQITKRLRLYAECGRSNFVRRLKHFYWIAV
jgi:hypothetical protein